MTLKSMFPKTFIAQVAGAMTMGAIESVVEYYSPELFKAPHRISDSNPPLLGVEPLLPVASWMTLIPFGVVGMALAAKARKANMKAFGEGIAYYAFPRLVSREMVRTARASQRNWKPPALSGMSVMSFAATPRYPRR
jgi:hypothetical protein